MFGRVNVKRGKSGYTRNPDNETNKWIEKWGTDSSNAVAVISVNYWIREQEENCTVF